MPTQVAPSGDSRNVRIGLGAGTGRAPGRRWGIIARFAPQDAEGRADPNGIRQFVAGAGGAKLYNISPVRANSEARNAADHGWSS